MSEPPPRKRPRRRAQEQDPGTEPAHDASSDETFSEETLQADGWEEVGGHSDRGESEPEVYDATHVSSADDGADDSEETGEWSTGPTEQPRATRAPKTGRPPGSAPASSAGSSAGSRTGRTVSRTGTSGPASAPYVPGSDKVESRLPSGTMLGGRFEVIRQLGKGGMGEVFLVRDHQIERREVALKLVRAKWSENAKFRELFFQEIRSAQKFVSPHVVQVRDCGQLPDGQLFLTMDYVAGESLSQLLRREKNLGAKHAIEIIRQLLMGLSSGHEHGFIHRDVKPGNLMLAARVLKTGDNPFGVKAGLLDFGLAALTEELEAERGPGTPNYMSPEQALGQRLDARSDLFAVGVVLFEMLAGKRPFSGRSAKEVIASVIETDTGPLIDNLEGVKKPVKKLLRKAMQKEREKRFSSAADFLKALDHVGPLQTEEGAPKAMTGIATLATIAAIGAGGLFFNERIAKKTADERFAQEKSEFERSKNLLTEKEAALASANRTIGELNDATELATKPLKDEIKVKNLELIKLTDALEVEREKLQGQGDQITRLQGTLADDEIVKGLRKVDYTALKIGAFQQIKDLLALIPRANDLEGLELAAYGRMFDRMTQQVIEKPQPESSICRIKLSRRPPERLDVPGLAYLVEVEAIGNQVGELLGRPTDVTAKDLETARQELTRLGSSFMLASFQKDTTSTRAGLAATGRWLGIRDLEVSELDQRFWDRIKDRVDESNQKVIAEAMEAAVNEEAARTVSEGIQKEIPDENQRATKFLALMREYGGTEALNKILLDFHRDEALEAARIETLTEVFSTLGERLDQIQATIDAEAASIAQEALGEKNLSLQAGLIQKFAAQVGDLDAPEIPGLLGSCAKSCRSAVAGGGGLDARALAALPLTVEDLVDFLGERNLDESQGASAASLIELQWFVFAKRWYGSTLPTDLGDNASGWTKRFADRLSSAPTDSHGAGTWKELLAFQVQLANACVGPPQAKRATATYIVQPMAQEGMRAYWERLEVSTNSGEKQLTTNEYRDGRTTPLPEVSGPSVGASSFFWDARRLMPLQGPIESPEFVLWTAPSEDRWEAMRKQRGTPLASLSGSGRLMPLLHEAYREIPTDEIQYRCLRVVLDNDTTYLVHPVLGVVKKVKTARNTSRVTVIRDLIHVHHSN